MRLPMLWYFSAALVRFLETHTRRRTVRSIGLAGGDRQTALDYELSFWRAAAPVWY
ncbi:hypothetical protein [Rhizobium sp. BK379]|uniref:hypothetical protein n=1 Tax=Rhizobium sp. BK379 TaxID=2587059 RepID=UPI00160A6688|nr:hypothetical protein [Rhizobium sp. BK379]MBB3444519.1 hypothetical protein [Rhizobium sp. BK379]